METEYNGIFEIDRDEISQIAQAISAYYARLNQSKKQKSKQNSEGLACKEPCAEYSVSKSASYSIESFKSEYRIENREKIKKPISNSYSSCSIPPISLEMTFAEKLFALMDYRGMTNPQVYKAANLDKSLFSKITSDKNYSPSKETAISIALALSLNLRETKDLLERAGYTLSRSTLRDAAVEYCIKEKIFNVVKVNIILDELGCQPLSRIR